MIARFTPLLLLALLLACKKENKETECRFTKITYPGSPTKLPVTYLPGDTVVKVGEDYPGYTLFFDRNKRLLRKEEPALNPYYRSDLDYNSNGQVTALIFSSKQGNSWVSESRLLFTYENGRIVNVKEENTASQPGHIYDHQIAWQGNDVVSVEHRLNQQAQCKTQFSYDGAMPNPMRRFTPFYFVDGDANYVYYKLPYYFGEHLLTKQESSCPLSETRPFNYTFAANGLIESMSGPNTTWMYEYECNQ